MHSRVWSTWTQQSMILAPCFPFMTETDYNTGASSKLPVLYPTSTDSFLCHLLLTADRPTEVVRTHRLPSSITNRNAVASSFCKLWSDQSQDLSYCGDCFPAGSDSSQATKLPRFMRLWIIERCVPNFHELAMDNFGWLYWGYSIDGNYTHRTCDNLGSGCAHRYYCPQQPPRSHGYRVWNLFFQVKDWCVPCGFMVIWSFMARNSFFQWAMEYFGCEWATIYLCFVIRYCCCSLYRTNLVLHV